MLRALCTILVVLSASCGEPIAENTLEGTYTIEQWALSEGDCSTDGEPILATQPARRLRLRMNGDTLEAALCIAAGSCTVAWRMTALDDSTWSGEQITFAANGAGDCSGNMEELLLTRVSERELHMEIRHLEETHFAPRDGVCCPDAAETACRERACAACEVISAISVGTQTQQDSPPKPKRLPDPPAQ